MKFHLVLYMRECLTNNYLNIKLDNMSCIFVLTWFPVWMILDDNIAVTNCHALESIRLVLISEMEVWVFNELGEY